MKRGFDFSVAGLMPVQIDTNLNCDIGQHKRRKQSNKSIRLSSDDTTMVDITSTTAWMNDMFCTQHGKATFEVNFQVYPNLTEIHYAIYTL